MNYQIFEQLDRGDYRRKDGESGQLYMERILRQAFLMEPGVEKEHIYERMCSSFYKCDYENKVLEVKFPVQEWELNPMQTMHGGLIATAVDMACGILVRFFKGSVSAATVQLSVDFLRPLSCGEAFVVRAKINKQGKRIIFLTAEVISKDSGQTAATASGTFV